MPKTQEILYNIRSAVSSLSAHGNPVQIPVPCKACQREIDDLSALADAIERDGIEDFEETIERAAGLAAQADVERLTAELGAARAELGVWQQAQAHDRAERVKAENKVIDLGAALVAAQRERESMRFELAETRGDRTRALRELSAARAELAGARESAESWRRDFNAVDRDNRRLTEERDDARAKLDQVGAELAGFAALRLALPDVLDRAGLNWTRDLLKLGDITPARAVSNLGEVVGTLRGLLKDSQAKHDAALAELAQAKSEAAALRRALAEADRHIAGPMAVGNNLAALGELTVGGEPVSKLIERCAAKLRPGRFCFIPAPHFWPASVFIRPCETCGDKPDATTAPAQGDEPEADE